MPTFLMMAIVDKEARTYDIGLEFLHNIEKKKVTRLFDKDGTKYLTALLQRKTIIKKIKILIQL